MFSAIASDMGNMRTLYENRQTEQRARNSADRWNEIQMSREDNAYQRSSKDLEAAGLNRILALGGSANSAQGSSTQGAPSPDFASSAQHLKMDPLSKAQVKNLSAQTAKTEAETNNIKTELQKKQLLEKLWGTANNTGAKIQSKMQEINKEQSKKYPKLNKHLKDAKQSFKASGKKPASWPKYK